VAYQTTPFLMTLSEVLHTFSNAVFRTAAEPCRWHAISLP